MLKYFSGRLESDLFLTFQLEFRVMDHETTTPPNQDTVQPVDDNANQISESILKCLIKVFLRMSSNNNSTSVETLPSHTTACSFDPYNLCSMFGKRDIGPYKHLLAIERFSINPNRTTISAFHVQRLKLV